MRVEANTLDFNSLPSSFPPIPPLSIQAIKRVLDQGLKQDDASSASSPPPSPFLSSSSTPSQRQEAMEVLLRLEDWRLALLGREGGREGGKETQEHERKT